MTGWVSTVISKEESASGCALGVEVGKGSTRDWRPAGRWFEPG